MEPITEIVLQDLSKELVAQAPTEDELAPDVKAVEDSEPSSNVVEGNIVSEETTLGTEKEDPIVEVTPAAEATVVANQLLSAVEKVTEVEPQTPLIVTETTGVSQQEPGTVTTATEDKVMDEQSEATEQTTRSNDQLAVMTGSNTEPTEATVEPVKDILDENVKVDEEQLKEGLEPKVLERGQLEATPSANDATASTAPQSEVQSEILPVANQEQTVEEQPSLTEGETPQPVQTEEESQKDVVDLTEVPSEAAAKETSEEVAQISAQVETKPSEPVSAPEEASQTAPTSTQPFPVQIVPLPEDAEDGDRLEVPSPKSRSRLASSTSSRLLPGGWKTDPKPQGRESLDIAQGVFSPPAREEETKKKKKRSCLIM